MESKFSQFLKDQAIDPRRVLSASRALERHRPADRQIKLEKRLARKDENAAAQKKEWAKPRSGRPVTERLLTEAVAGKPVSGPAKTRLLRAVNRLLEQKKKEQATLSSLFGK